MKFLLRIAPIAVLAAAGLALSGGVAMAVSVKASVSCSAWLAERHKEKGAEKLGSLFNRRWLIGYLSGLAAGRNKEFWDPPNASPLGYDAAFQWMDSYCRANPSRDIAEGADKLFHERTRGK
jgi:hypothetical protein